jgi:hypothetical protein
MAQCRKVEKPSFAITQQGDTLFTAKAYANYILDEQLKIRKITYELGQLLKTDKKDSVWSRFEQMADTVQSSLMRIRQLKPFDHDTIFYPATLHLFRFYEEMVQSRMFQFLTYYLKAPNDKNAIKWANEIKQREKEADSVFNVSFEWFRAEYQINN